jgi:hypothetical protein
VVCVCFAGVATSLGIQIDNSHCCAILLGVQLTNPSTQTLKGSISEI